MPTDLRKCTASEAEEEKKTNDKFQNPMEHCFQ